MADDGERSTLRERRVHLWVTVVASLIAAVLGSGVGGYFSYQASKDASKDQAAQAQAAFVRQQRQVAYMQAATSIAALEAASKTVIYDSLPYNTAVTGQPGHARISTDTGSGQNSIGALRASYADFQSKEQQLAGLSATIAIVGSPKAVRQFQALIERYEALDGNLWDAEYALSQLPNNLTRQQVLSVSEEFASENDDLTEAKTIASQFEATARTDLNIT